MSKREACTRKKRMPRVKNPKRKPIAYSCLYDRGFHEVYAGNVLMSKHETKKAAQNKARRLRKARPSSDCRSHVTIRYGGICTYTEICKYWKSCYEVKGITFSQPWGKKMLMLLEMKRHAQPEPKDKELNQFFRRF